MKFLNMLKYCHNEKKKTLFVLKIGFPCKTFLRDSKRVISQ